LWEHLFVDVSVIEIQSSYFNYEMIPGDEIIAVSVIEIQSSYFNIKIEENCLNTSG